MTLVVVNTMTAAGDDGVFVRSAPGEDGARLTGARLNQTIYAVCRVTDGLDVDGNRVWVKSPYHFVDGDLAADGTFPYAKSYSDPTSADFGWITSEYLSPKEAIDGLPICT